MTDRRGEPLGTTVAWGDCALVFLGIGELLDFRSVPDTARPELHSLIPRGRSTAFLHRCAAIDVNVLGLGFDKRRESVHLVSNLDLESLHSGLPFVTYDVVS